jgi:ABC-type Na+ efflux pump permease subunit
VASVFAAGAALVSRQEDTGAVMTPAMMLVMIPYFGVVLFGDNPLIMTVLSYIPFSAPVGMPVRLFFGEAQWWEPLISLALLVVATAAVMLVASKIYTNSLLGLKPFLIGPDSAAIGQEFLNALTNVEQGKGQPAQAWDAAVKNIKTAIGK